jgi:16S rRNA processing protein RimM
VGFVVIAQLLRARGNKGELSAAPLSDSHDRFANLKRVFVGGHERAVETVWWHGDRLVFKFAGIDSISQAEELGGLDVSIPIEERIQLEEGAFFLSDLIGCELFDVTSGNRIGVVRDWQEPGGSALLEVEGEGGLEILVPFAHAICVKIDVAAKRIDADLPEGLIDLNRR